MHLVSQYKRGEGKKRIEQARFGDVIFLRQDQQRAWKRTNRDVKLTYSLPIINDKLCYTAGKLQWSAVMRYCVCGNKFSCLWIPSISAIGVFNIKINCHKLVPNRRKGKAFLFLHQHSQGTDCSECSFKILQFIQIVWFASVYCRVEYELDWSTVMRPGKILVVYNLHRQTGWSTVCANGTQNSGLINLKFFPLWRLPFVQITSINRKWTAKTWNSASSSVASFFAS